MLLALTGCSQKLKYGADNMPYGQIHGALASRHDDGPGIMGRIEAITFEPTPGLASASAFKNEWKHGYPVEYLGISSGRICFKTQYFDTYRKGFDTEIGTHNNVVYVFNGAKQLVRAYATFDEVTEKTEWEEGATTDIDQVKVTVNTNTPKMYTSADGAPLAGGELLFDIVLCGKAPVLDATSRYLTFSWLAGGVRDAPLLFLWAIDAPDAGATPEPTVADAGFAPTTGMRQPSSSQTIVDVLAADGRFTWLVKIIAVTGLADTLGETEPYTLFAMTDAKLLRRTSAAELTKTVVAKNHDELRPSLQQFIVHGVHPPAELTGANPELSASRGFLHFKRSGGKLQIDDGEVVLPPLPASNGLIYPVQ